MTTTTVFTSRDDLIVRLHAFDAFRGQIERFTTESGGIWRAQDDFAVPFGEGCAATFVTIEHDEGKRFSGHVGFVFFDPATGKIREAFFDDIALADSTFASFAEASHVSAFTAESFRMFPRHL